MLRCEGFLVELFLLFADVGHGRSGVLIPRVGIRSHPESQRVTDSVLGVVELLLEAQNPQVSLRQFDLILAEGLVRDILPVALLEELQDSFRRGGGSIDRGQNPLLVLFPEVPGGIDHLSDELGISVDGVHLQPVPTDNRGKHGDVPAGHQHLGLDLGVVEVGNLVVGPFLLFVLGHVLALEWDPPGSEDVLLAAVGPKEKAAIDARCQERKQWVPDAQPLRVVDLDLRVPAFELPMDDTFHQVAEPLVFELFDLEGQLATLLVPEGEDRGPPAEAHDDGEVGGPEASLPAREPGSADVLVGGVLWEHQIRHETVPGNARGWHRGGQVQTKLHFLFLKHRGFSFLLGRRSPTAQGEVGLRWVLESRLLEAVDVRHLVASLRANEFPRTKKLWLQFAGSNTIQ